MKSFLRVVCLAVIAVGIAVSAGWLRAGPTAVVAATPDEGSDPDRVDSTSFERWLPALREGADVTFSGKSGGAGNEHDEPTPIARVATLGPLDDAEIARCTATLEQISHLRFSDLHALPMVTEPGVPYGLLQQAQLLCAAEEHLAAARALAAGDYFVTEPGKLPPAPPGAGIVQTTARQKGQRVVVSIVLPFEKHRRFADAYHYKNEIWLNYPAHAVDYWNRQDENWRRTSTARLIGREGSADAAWCRRYAPGGTTVDVLTGTLALVQ